VTAARKREPYERWATFTVVCPAFNLIDFPGVMTWDGRQTAWNFLIEEPEAEYLMDLVQHKFPVVIFEKGGVPRRSMGFEVIGRTDDLVHVRFL
jgi:hypothetical protein